ncbi:MAG: ATPase [Sphaerochaetaceae bacterium]|nr:ATPase [Sphaerochaetaceae bacterium]
MKKRTRPGTYLVLGFLTIILFGSLLLNLPLSRTENSTATYLDCLFVSVSSVCVTGLTTVDLANNFTVFGRVVVLSLIQLGGLGFATFALFILTALGKGLSFSELSVAKEAINFDSEKGVVDLILSVLKYSLTIEAAGTVLLYFPYYKLYPSFFKALGMSVFHSVSAFNNAGFDLNGNLSSLEVFNGNIYVYCVICALIILGGLGFFVLQDILKNRKWNKFSLHTKIVLSTSAFLIVFGTIFLFFGGLPFMDAFFSSVSARTAGFSTFSMEKLSGAGRMVLIILMFIGASPGSTGGGVKTSTIAVICFSMVSVIRGRKSVAFKRKISQQSINKALAVFFLAIMVVVSATFALLMIENDKDPVAVLFEVVSAAATVGLSISLTPSLHLASKIIIMAVMFIGRLGPLTIATVLSKPLNERLDYIEEHVIIG